METKSSAEIVDELLKELQGQSCNLHDYIDNKKGSNSDNGEQVNKIEITKSRKHKKRDRSKEQESNADYDESAKHKYRKKQKHKKKKKKQSSDNHVKNHKSGKRRHKHKHKGKSEKNYDNESHSSHTEDSVEIEWESDHENIEKLRILVESNNVNCQTKSDILNINVPNKDSKEVYSEAKAVSDISIKEKLNELQIVLLENKDTCIKNETNCGMKSNDDECKDEDFPGFNDSSVHSSSLAKTDELVSTLLDHKTDIMMDITGNSNDGTQKEESKEGVLDDAIQTNIAKGMISKPVALEHENDKEKEKSPTSDLKSISMDQPVGVNIELNQKRILELREDGELSGTSNSIDNISKESSACSADDSDGDIDSGRKRRKSKSSKKHKRHVKKRKYSQDVEDKGKKYRFSSRSRSRSRSPHKSKRQRRSHSQSADSCSSVTGDRSPSHRNRKTKSRSHRSRSLLSSRHKTYSRSKSHERERRRSRSPRRVHHSDLREKIDKAKLLEIARKNAMVMITQGKLPAGVNVDSLKKEQFITSKSAGKSVEELTDFCKQLVKKEGDSSSSDNEKKDIRSEDEGEGPFIQHPFKLREAQPNIVLNIRNAVQIPVKTPAEKAAETAKLRIQFPVSSGSQHRKKESEWIPVSRQAKDTLPVIPAQPQNDKVFQEKPSKPETIDIGSIISQRLKAVRKLQENPQDIEALTQMYSAQQQMQSWAESKQLPGQFTGVTDARLLTPAELAGPAHTQAWVKKDLFNKAAPIDGGMGMYLLRKMGWNPGEGLGKNKEGTTEPLVLDIKTDKKGLTSSDETARKIGAPVPVLKDLSGKHPVSALVELCSKRKWGPPEFTLIHDSGPDHKKNFLFKVRINNIDYQPTIASPNKKHAKAQAATVCLQHLGLLPRSYNTLA